MSLLHEAMASSIKEIASICGISPATVSRVLNQDLSLSVSDSVRRKIIDTASSLGYMTPRQKRMEKAISVAIAFSPFDRAGFEERIISHLTAIAPAGITIRAYDRSSHTNGLIAIGEFSRDEVKDFEAMSDALLLINNLGTSYSHDSIMMDYSESEERVVRLFCDRGLRRAAYIGGTFLRSGHEIGRTRAVQFSKLLEKYSMFDSSRFFLGTMDEEFGYSAAMKLDPETEAVIFSDIDCANGALRAFDERGINPLGVTYENFFPEDVRTHYALWIFPDGIFRSAFSLILERIRGERTQSYCVYAPSDLVETNSLDRV